MTGGEHLICHISNTIQRKMPYCDLVRVEWNCHVLTEMESTRGRKSHWAFQHHAHLSGTNSRSWDQNAAECFWRPPVDHIQVHFPRFPLHTVVVMVPPGQSCVLSWAHWKSSRKSRQKQIWTHTADIHLSSATSGSDQISLAGITATEEHKCNVILIT